MTLYFRHIQYLALPILLCLITTGNGAELDGDALRRALAGPDREVTDFVRDQARKPVEVLEFLGIGPGMQVLDVYAAGGYYSFILARAVGPQGHVYAQNTPRGLNFREDRQEISQGEALENKIRQGNLSNVTHLVQALEALDIEPGSLDGILLAQTLHDSYNSNPERALAILLRLRELLKPGGVLGITDHIGTADYDNRALHRMQTEQAIAISEQAGFRVESSELLRNPADDHSRSIFDPRLNRNTDRFLLKLSKGKE